MLRRARLWDCTSSVRLSISLSVRNDQIPWSHRLEFFENNFTAYAPADAQHGRSDATGTPPKLGWNRGELEFNYRGYITMSTSLRLTRKLSYRKDDRAMRLIWCFENFREFLSTPTALLFRNFECASIPIDPMNARTKFQVYSFTRAWDNRG